MVGQFVFDNLQNASAHYPYADIPLFVVMPNHFHAIIFIDGERIPCQRGIKPIETLGDTFGISVQTGRAPSQSELLSPAKNRDGARPVGTEEKSSINEKMKLIDSYKGWLSVVVGGIKSAVTKFARENGTEFSWHARFHDRIVRNQNEMNRIADYIENNVARWEADCFNKSNL